VTQYLLFDITQLPCWQWQHRTSWHVLPLSATTNASQSAASKNASGPALL